MARCQSLKRFERVGHHQEVGVAHFTHHIVDAVHHKVSHALLIERRDIVMAVVVGSLNCEEYGFFGVIERARVGEQLAHGGFLVADTVVVNTQNVGYLYD